MECLYSYTIVDKCMNCACNTMLTYLILFYFILNTFFSGEQCSVQYIYNNTMVDNIVKVCPHLLFTGSPSIFPVFAYKIDQKRLSTLCKCKAWWDRATFNHFRTHMQAPILRCMVNHYLQQYIQKHTINI